MLLVCGELYNKIYWQYNGNLSIILYTLPAITTCINGKKMSCSMKISQAISRTTGPNIGLFVLILMHFSCWFQLWAQNVTIVKFLKIFWKKLNIICTENSVWRVKVQSDVEAKYSCFFKNPSLLSVTK